MQRLELVHQWLAGLFPGRPHSVAPASADASFRRYFRVSFDDGSSRIVMDAPPEHEDCRPFVHVAGLLHGAGVHAPEILAQDIEHGLLLLTDLGRATYLDVLDESNADDLFRDAVDALVKWQLASRPNELPPYDEALLRRELALFPDWYVARHLGTPLSAAQQDALESVQALLLQNILAQPQVYVHRDYMPRNLMVCADNPGVLDFQDAVCGPITYDVASLFRDAFISWEEERVLDWAVRYWEKAKRAGLPVDADFGAFYRDMEWMGLQRHLKVLGIFARINYRDGKPKYLADTPRFLHYVRHAATRYAQLAPLARLLDELEQRAPQVGYTF
ncbi:MAG: aminoglycoside phosphotransferase [Rhodocyclales bacterium]|jgi:aminoglycoside/choline kinase family phosphotransferase|nr:phosphotransferase [Rhodocyclaceae bacterium]PWB44370.1 MAG: aminoglycoside phosphotransferase [Rhodocyclales bacterium]